jgi:hypothetical protein
MICAERNVMEKAAHTRKCGLLSSIIMQNNISFDRTRKDMRHVVNISSFRLLHEMDRKINSRKNIMAIILKGEKWYGFLSMRKRKRQERVKLFQQKLIYKQFYTVREQAPNLDYMKEDSLCTA